jgi:hypothetical protein
MSDLKNLKKSGPGDFSVPPSIDPAQLSIGIQSEMEHTNDVKIAKQIALDHLKEDPEYYTKLAKAGLAHDFEGIPSSGYGDPDATFNDESRVGDSQFIHTNIGGTIGNTSKGEISGRRSEPILKNKTVSIDISEAKKKKKKKKPKPTNPKLWAAVKAWARRKFDVYPSAYANGAAAKRYKKHGGGWRMSESTKCESSKCSCKNCSTHINDNIDFSTSPSTYSCGYDKIGESTEFNLKNTSIMKTDKLKAVIKEILKEELDNNQQNYESPMNVTGPEDMEKDASEKDEGESESVTITLDKETAKKMHDILMAALDDVKEEPDDESDSDDSAEEDEKETELKESKIIKKAKLLVKQRNR